MIFVDTQDFTKYPNIIYSTREKTLNGQTTLQGMISEVERYLKEPNKASNDYPSEWNEGAIQISTNLMNGNDKDNILRKAMEEIFHKYGDQFKFDNELPTSTDSISEFLQKNGIKNHPEKSGYDVKNRTFLETDKDGKVINLKVFLLLPKAPIVDTPEGHRWQLARATIFSPLKRSGVARISHCLSYVKIPSK